MNRMKQDIADRIFVHLISHPEIIMPAAPDRVQIQRTDNLNVNIRVTAHDDRPPRYFTLKLSEPV